MDEKRRAIAFAWGTIGIPVLLFGLGTQVAAMDRQAYVVSFSENEPAMKDLSAQLTQEFEGALLRAGCVTLLERRKLDFLLAHRESESGPVLKRLQGIPPTDRANLGLVPATGLIFGTVKSDPESGELVVSAEYDLLDGTKLAVETARMSVGKRFVAQERARLLSTLAEQLCASLQGSYHAVTTQDSKAAASAPEPKRSDTEEGGTTFLYEDFEKTGLDPRWQASGGGVYDWEVGPGAFGGSGRSLRITGPYTIRLDLPSERFGGHYIIASAQVRTAAIEPVPGKKFYERGTFHVSYEDPSSGEFAWHPSADQANFTTTPATSTWQVRRASCYVPRGATQINLFTGIQDNTGTLWLDQIQVVIASEDRTTHGQEASTPIEQLPVSFFCDGNTYVSSEVTQDKFGRKAPGGSRFYIAGGGDTWDPPFKLEIQPGDFRGHRVLVFEGKLPTDFQVVWWDPDSKAANNGWVWSPVYELFHERLGVYIKDPQYLYRPVLLEDCR